MKVLKLIVNQSLLRYFGIVTQKNFSNTVTYLQVDIEMSFTTKDRIQRLIENLLLHAWPKELGTLQIPFTEMRYEDAMTNYGVDKPDTRFGNLVTRAPLLFARHWLC